MEPDAWYDNVSLESYCDEQIIVQSLDDADLEAEHYGDREYDKRVFKLTDFFVYNKNTMKLVSLDLDVLDDICVAGHAVPIRPQDSGPYDDDESESGEESPEFDMALSAIQKVEYTYLDISSAGHDGIYLLTTYGWYLLQRPIGFYRVPYQEPFRQFRLVLAIIKRCYEDPEERLSAFVSKFRRLAERTDREYTHALDWGYRPLHPVDLQSSSDIISKNIRYYLGYLANELHGETDRVRCDSIKEARERLVQSRVIIKILEGHLATIRKRDGAPLDPVPDLPLDTPAPTPVNERNAYEITAEGHESAEEDEIMEDVQAARRSRPARRTCVTPIVERTARRVFPNTLNLVGNPLPDVTWRRSRGEGTPFPSATKLKRGQYIMLPAGVDEAYPQQDWAFNHEKSTSENPYANDYWFAQVIATTADGQQVHVRWFDHSAKTDLMAYFERPMELFLTRRCGYVARNHVQRLVEVKLLEPDEKPPHREQQYYFRFIRELDGNFTRARSSDVQLQPPPSTSCHVCDALEAEQPWYENRTLRIGGVLLHKGDYIVINPLDRVPWFPSNFRNSIEAKNTPPGQILRVIALTRTESHGRHELSGLLLQSLERVELLKKRGIVSEEYSSCEGRPTHDERRLCLMDKWDVHLDLADAKRCPIRKCFVRHPDTFESHDEMNTWLDSSAVHFIVDLQGVHSAPPARPTDLQRPPVTSVTSLTHETFVELASPCKTCVDEASGPRVTKMRMLDLFCGAGGLSRGLVQSGICDAKYAIDHDEAALKTYEANFPGVTAIHQDVNIALSEILIAALNGDDRESIAKDPDDPPPLPDRHEIDFICGGPPCQSFSAANRFKKEDDVRMTMIAAIMSAVEHYQPKYFVIENVPDALTCKLLGPSPHSNSADSDDSPTGTPPPRHPIEQGVFRFVMRATLDLGYSFRAGILQAGCYGAPQTRRRAFIIGARGDLTLPAFPLTTHRIQAPRTGLMMPTGGYSDSVEPASGFGLHQRTTLWDAIGDLKAFEWINPHTRIAETNAARAEVRQRRTNGIPVFNAVHNDRREVGLGADGAVGYRDGTPLTTYQLQARGNQTRVTGHYTSSFKSGVFVERVVSVPLSARADHRSLPEILRRDDFLSNIFGSGGASGYYRGAFGRYDKNDLFATILTALRPAKKNGFCIHPEQKRMLTMRELARAQGFSDDFEFTGSVDEVNRQIGNAVVVHVSRAVGNEIKKAMIKDKLL